MDERIGDILVKWGIISLAQLQEALKTQKVTKKKLGKILMDMGLVNEQIITEALAQEYHLPVVTNIAEYPIDIDLVKMFPYQLLKKHHAFPLSRKEEYITVAVNDPLDLSIIQEMRNLSGYKIQPVLVTPKDIEELLKKALTHIQSSQEAIEELSAEKPTQEQESIKDLEIAAQDAPIVRLVNSVIIDAIEQKVSDIHFEPQKDNLRVRFRIDGLLYRKHEIPKDIQPAVISRIKIISGMDIAEKRKPQDGRLNIGGMYKNIDIRVSTLPDIFGEKVVLRLLDKSGALKPLEELGMDEDELKKIKSLIFQPYGIILVTGPTGSGKTTTLYSILNILNDETKNIITVEDPVEYELEGINQTAVNVRAGYTFATAIRHILRQDPDIIMIGEIRDLETAEIAIQAALTGHLVFSTLHTNTAAGAITRLMDMNVEPFLISSAVIGVIAQRLVRRLCPECKKEYEAHSEIKPMFKDVISLDSPLKLAKPSGCDKCFNIGYKGREGIFEIMALDDQIKDMILRRANEPEITQYAVSRGMNTLRISGLKKALKHITSLEEVMRVTFG